MLSWNLVTSTTNWNSEWDCCNWTSIVEKNGLLGKYRWNNAHNKRNNNNWYPSFKSNSGNKLIRNSYNYKRYHKSNNSKCKKSNRKRNDSQYSSDNKIHESKYKYKNEQRLQSFWKDNTIKVFHLYQGIDCKYCYDKLEKKTHKQ